MAKITKSYTVKRIAELTEKNSKFNKQILELQEQSIRDNQIYNEELAEKEKEINQRYKDWQEEIRESDRLREELAKTNKEWVQSIHDWKELCEKKDQDKISFCIEQLTDVRSFVSDATEIKEPDYTKVCNYIEKQIEELKKEMK